MLRRFHYVSFRVATDEYDFLQELCNIRGKSQSDLLRDILVQSGMDSGLKEPESHKKRRAKIWGTNENYPNRA
jgi:hypothetical protein